MMISAPLAALREMRRVLKPRATLRRTRPVARAYGRALATPADAVMAPYLRWLSLRPESRFIRAAGFEISELRNEYAHGWVIHSWSNLKLSTSRAGEAAEELAKVEITSFPAKY